MQSTKCMPAIKSHLQHTTFDHDLHTVDRNSGYLIDGIFEDYRREIGVELHIVNFSCVFNMYCDRSHERG